MADRQSPKMQRLGSSNPEMKRLSPVSTGDDTRPDSEKQVEASWSESPSQDSDAGRTFSLLWVGLLTCTAIAALIYLATRASSPSPDTSAKRPTLPAEQRWENAEILLLGFFAADTTAEKLDFVLDPTRVGPFLEEYYGRADAARTELREIRSVQFVDIYEHPWCHVEFSDQNGKLHLADLKETPDGYELDWESLVAYGEMPWDRFRRERPPTSTQMRVYLARTSYYEHKYSDPTQHIVFRIESDDTPEFLYGYAERGSMLHRELHGHVAPGARRPMTLGLRFEPDAGADNLIVIDALINPRWTAQKVPEAAGE